MTEQLSLTHDGVEMYDYPAGIQQQVAAAAAAWHDFLQLGQPAKEHFAATALQSGIGYEKKGSGERESNDTKENFDITRASLTDLMAASAHTPDAQQFITAVGELFESLEEHIAAVGSHIEDTYHIPGFAEETRASAASAFVRCLYYPPVPAGTIIGESHVDHSGFTFHLYESTDGCERLTFDKHSWQPMPVSTHQAALFASMQTQLFSHGDIRGLCHRIIASDTTAKAGRTAIVCFVPLVNTPSYDRATHGRLQNMPPGFNYELTNKEFTSLFAATTRINTTPHGARRDIDTILS